MSPRRSPRRSKLSEADREIWDSVTRGIRPITRDMPQTAMPPSAGDPEVKPPAPAAPRRPPLPEGFAVGAKVPAQPAHDLAPSLPERLSIAGHALDRRTAAKLRRGRTRPEARLDLHGMTLAQAHPALIRFLGDAHARDLRLVLVITGKGKERDGFGPMPVPLGILRHQVPHWLTGGPLARVVARIAPAEQRHGGDGAYYVFLRRRR